MCGSPLPHPTFVSIRGPVVECPRCHTFRVLDSNRLTDQQDLFYSTIDEERYISYFAPFRKAQYRQVLKGLDLPPGSSLLDVGASYGWMVEEAVDLGLDAYGLEPGSAAVNEKIKQRMFRGSLAEYIEDTPRRFDVVTIWHVLEHLPDPVAAVADLCLLVRPGGKLVVAVPTCDGRMFRLALWMEKLFGSQRGLNELFYLHNPNMHYYYYGEAGLRLLLERGGLRIVGSQRLESFDWNRIYVRAASMLTRLLFRLVGPLIALSGFTSVENLVVVAERPE